MWGGMETGWVSGLFPLACWANHRCLEDEGHLQKSWGVIPLSFRPFKTPFFKQPSQIFLKGPGQKDCWCLPKDSKLGMVCFPSTSEFIFFSKFAFIFNWINIQLMWMSTSWNAILGIMEEFSTVDRNHVMELESIWCLSARAWCR